MDLDLLTPRARPLARQIVHVATLPGHEIAWEGGTVRVRPELLAEWEAADRGPAARPGLAAAGLKLQADVERRMSEPAYDAAPFDADDRPFRVPPGSADHARLVFAALGAEIEIDSEDLDADLRAIDAELRAMGAELAAMDP